MLPMKAKPPEDESQAAARVVGETIKRHEEPLPADLEQAWAIWSRSIQKADTRTMTLVKAAFEA